MQRWLFKTEPSTYSILDLQRHGQTNWDGIKNAMARIHLRSISPGDQILLYHTGGEKAVVGVIEAVSGPLPDKTTKDDKGVAVQVAFRKAFTNPVTLEILRKERSFATSDLIRQTRLSVLPVTEKQWLRIVQLAGE